MVKPPDRLSRGDLQQGSDQPVNLRQQEDFSSEQLAKRERAAATEVGETYRQILRQAERVQRGEAKIPRRVAGGLSGSVEKSAAERLRDSTEDYLKRTGREVEQQRYALPRTAAYMRNAEANFVAGRVEYASNLLDKFNQTREGQDLSKFPYLQELRTEAEKYGTKLSDDDVENLVMWGQLDQAADAYIRHVEMGNYIMAQNVVKTLSDPNKGNLVMASMFPTVVENKVKDLVGLDVRDPETVDSIISKAGELAGKTLGYLLGPGEEVYKYFTANVYEQGAKGGARGLAGQVLASSGIRLTAPSTDAYEATAKGKFNENYIQRLIGNPEDGLWTELEVELAQDVVRRQVLGEPNAVAAAWNAREDRESPEVAQFFTDIQFTFGPSGERVNKLIRQIQSVDLSSFSAIMSGAANPDLQYSPTRGDDWFKNTLSFGDIGVRLAGDPLNIVPIPIRSGIAAKWTIGKLAPGATDEFGNLYRAQDILKKRNLFGRTVNTAASRYFDNFANDLNRLDDLESAIVDATTSEARAMARQRAADFRRRMGRQYREMPEDLIESFRTSPAHARNAEGRFDLETVAKFIDDTNDTWLQMQGQLSTKAARDGIVEASDLAAIETFLQERPLFAPSVGRTTETRALMIPRRGPLGILRQNIVNNIIADVMPAGNARRILAESFDDTLTPAQIAQRLDDRFLEMGRMLSKNRGAGRWFSSIPSGLVISLDNAADAREFYRFARQFMDKSTASFLADAFRLGTPGSRRTLVAATVRSAAASRGTYMTRTEVDEWINRVTGSPTNSDAAGITGSASGEAYSVAIDLDRAKLPTSALSDFRRQKAAMARATTPEGIQEQLVTPTVPLEEGIARVPRIVNEQGEASLSLSRLDFQQTDEIFNDLYDRVSRLYNDPNANLDEVTTLGNQLAERESFLNAIYDRELQLLDIDKNIAQMPRTRVNEEGVEEILFPGHDENLITARAELMLNDIDPPAPAPSDFEVPSGVFMTPREAELYTKYGFLADSYLRRAYRNMVKAENARARIPEPPKISPKEAELTGANQEPVGGTEIFAYRLQRAESEREEAYESLMNKFGVTDEVDTNFTYGDVAIRLQEFDRARSVPGYQPPKRRKGKPELTVDEKIAIRDGSIEYDELFRLVKTEGRRLDADMADLIRRNYGINVRASAPRKTTQPMGIYVEWAENGTEAGRARLLERFKEEIREADELEYMMGAEEILKDLPALQLQRQELVDAIRGAYGEKPLSKTVDKKVSDQYSLLYDDIVSEADEIARLEGKTVDEMVLGAGDDLAAKLVNRRAEILLEDNPEFLNAGIYSGPSGLVIDTSSPLVRAAYLKKFYPNLKPNTRITLYRAVQEGEVPGSSVGTTGPAGGRIEPGAGAWWTTNPSVAARFSRTGQGRKIAVLDVSWEDLQKIDETFVPGPRTGSYGLDDEVIIDYTSDAFRAVSDQVSVIDKLDIPNPENLNALAAIKKVFADEPGLSSGAIAKLDELNNDALARLNGQRPMVNNPGDPIITATDDLAAADNLRTWSPSRDANGMEEAIHQYQIARSVRMLSIADIDEIHRQKTLTGKLFGATNVGIGRVVDAWSFATLFGPRFSVRNAIEELLFYVLTGGKVSDLYRGRRASTIGREARPRFVYETVKGTRGEEQELVIKTNLGLFNRLSRGYTLTGRLRDDMNQEWLASVIGQNSTRDDFIKAQLAWQAGDTSAYTKLFAKSLVRANGRIPTGMSAREDDALLWIAGSQHGQNLVQNVAEGGNSLLNGRLPSFTDDVARLEDLAPGEAEALMKEFPTFGPGVTSREYGALRPVKYDEAGRQINGQWWWWRELQAIVHGDGPIGKLAVKYIGDPETAKKAIADYVRQDTKWGYRDTWSMFADGRDIDEAASRYFENALRAFQKPNGEINWKLRNTFVEKINGEDVVNWYKPRKPGLTTFDDFSKGEKVHRLSLTELSRIPVSERPEYVFGRLPGVPEPVPVLTGWEGIVTKGYGILGRQNARLSREPIFYANYLNMVRQLEGSETAMATAMAKAAGRDTANEFDRAIAAEWTNKTAADSAYAMTMAYVDNPANRSLLAWRVRNVARYYRATEDFYRRAKRLAITRPEAYYRAALTYGLLEDTGFIFEDEEGTKYFYYPGNEYVQRAFATLSSVMPDVSIFRWDMASPFQIGGKVTGLTPSLDPRGLFPTAVGPATFPIAAAFELFPPLQELSGLKSLLVGPFVQPESSLIQLAYNTLTPAGVARLQQLDQDRLDSLTQQSAYDTIKIMIAEGLLDAESFGTETGVPSVESFMKSDVWREASSVAWGLTLTKFVLSWLGPAAPQVYEAGQINPAARDLGISSVDTVFRQLLELNKDEADPWSSAIAMYYAAKIRKNTGQPTKYDPWDSLLPFTLSGSKAAPDKLAGLAGVQATDAFVNWTQSQEYDELNSLPGAEESLMWLAPREGEFTWQAWGIVKNHYGLRVPKTTEEKLEALFAAEGQYRDTQIRKNYDEVIVQLDARDPEQKKEINRLEKAKQEERRLNETRNPFWSTVRSKGGTDYNQARLAQSVKQMEIFIDSVKDSGKKMPKSLVAIDDAIRVYRDFRSAISGLGQKNVELQQKAELTYEMNRVLTSIASGDENAKRFIETVLDTLNYGELTQLDPMLVEEGQ